MLFKTATCKAEISEIKPGSTNGLNKTAARHWTDPAAFPESYRNLIGNYVKAHTIAGKMNIGVYDPDFKYYRVIALHGDVPNDNGDLWWWGDSANKDEPELLRYDALIGKRVFETFAGRGNFKNHENDDVTKAVGLILDAAPNAEGRFIEALIAVDQKKDPDLVRGIDSGYINSVSMGCVKAGTLISLPDGNQIPVEEICAGQQVLTHLGNSKEVNNIQKRTYKKKIYKIKVMGVQEKLYITDEHPVWAITADQFVCKRRPTSKACKCTPENTIKTYCKYMNLKREYTGKNCDDINKGYKFDFIETKNLKVGDWVAFPFSREVDHPEWATKDLARLMGYYLSEGFCIKTRKGTPAGLSFCLNKNETAYIDEIVGLLNGLKTNDNMPIVKSSATRLEIVDINLFDQPLANKIHDLCGEYAKYKKLDQSVLYWKPEIQLEMVGTFINGDGCCIKTKYSNGSTYLSSASKMLVNQFYIMLLRNNIVSCIQTIKRNRDREINGHKIIDGIQYQLHIGTYFNEVLSKVSDKIKTPDKTTNNYTRRRFIYQNYLIAPIKSIEMKEYDDFVYNFEVDGDNSYVANEIAVHNCVCGYSICTACGHKATNEREYCFVPETKILMADGTIKNINDVQVEDCVIDKNGKSSKVIKVFQREIDEDILNVKFKNGENPYMGNMMVTKNHPISSIIDAKCIYDSRSVCVGKKKICNIKHCHIYEDKDFDFVPAESLKTNDSIVAKFKISDDGHTNTQYTKEDMMIFGYYLAEGSLVHQYRNNYTPQQKTCSVIWKHIKNGCVLLQDICHKTKYTYSVVYAAVARLNKEGYITIEKKQNPDNKTAYDYIVLNPIKPYEISDEKSRKIIYGVEFSFSLEEEVYVEELVNALKTRVDNVCVYEKDHTYSIKVNNQEFAMWINGLLGNGSHDKKIDASIMSSTKDLLECLLNAYINGDGYMHEDKNVIDIKTTSEQLAHQSECIARLCGYTASIQYVQNGHGGPSNRFAHLEPLMIYNVCLTATGKTWYNVLDITNTPYQGRVYNLETEDGSYIANGCIVHNCDHLKYQKGQTIWHEGKNVKVAEDNRQVNFIELSWVTVPADPYAKLLEKVASKWNEVLSQDTKIIYSVVSQALNDAKLIASPEEFNNLIMAIKQEIDSQ